MAEEQEVEMVAPETDMSALVGEDITSKPNEENGADPEPFSSLGLEVILKDWQSSLLMVLIKKLWMKRNMLPNNEGC